MFKGTDSINELLEYVLQLKREPKRDKNKIIENNIHILAYIGSGFDSYVVLNILLQWKTVASLMKSGLAIVSLKMFNGFVDQNK